MKKSVNSLFMTLFVFICFLPLTVSAESIINNNGVVISESDYEKISKIHTDAYIMTMSQSRYDELKLLNYDNVRSDTKYIRTSYNSNLDISTSTEVTEEDYNNAGTAKSVVSRTSGGDFVETAYKKLTLAATDSNSYTHTIITCVWKIMPATRSFDVNGLRLQNYTMVTGTYNGTQVYKTGGTFHTITYASNGTNIKVMNSGYGISMNLVNDSVTYLESTTTAVLEPGSGGKAIYAAYEHATSNVSLANSKAYTLGGEGLGGVFVWPYSINQHYDGMSGAQILG